MTGHSTPAPAEPIKPKRDSRAVATAALVVLTAISIVLATLGVWVRQVVYDTDTFMDVVSPAFDDPVVLDNLSLRLGDGVVEALAVEERIDDTLTGVDDFLADQLVDLLNLSDETAELLDRLDVPQLADVAPTISGVLEEQVREFVDRFVRSEAFQELLPATVRAAHEDAVALLRGDYDQLDDVVVTSGEVRLNLIPLIVEAIEFLIREGIDLMGFNIDLPDFPEAETVQASLARLAALLGRDLPADFGQVTLMSTDDLSEMQATAVSFDDVIWLYLAVTVALAIMTLVVSARRWRALGYLALGAAAAFGVAYLAIRAINQQILDSVRASPDREVTASAVGDLIGIMQGVGALLLVSALIIALIAFLAGRPRDSSTVRVA